MTRTWQCILVAVAAFAAGGVVLAQQRTADTPGLPTICIAGDSTAAEGTEGARGWGRHLARFFDPARVRIENRARGGRSSRTFITEGLWGAIHSELQPGDVVLIQFGHNDGGAINDAERARGSMQELGAETRDRGAIPILVTLTVRNIWNDGHVERGSGRYSEWIRELAHAENVALIDLTSLGADYYERIGEAAAAKTVSSAGAILCRTA